MGGKPRKPLDLENWFLKMWLPEIEICRVEH
jgi:hypothetical protein